MGEEEKCLVYKKEFYFSHREIYRTVWINN